MTGRVNAQVLLSLWKEKCSVLLRYGLLSRPNSKPRELYTANSIGFSGCKSKKMNKIIKRGFDCTYFKNYSKADTLGEATEICFGNGGQTKIFMPFDSQTKK